MKKEVLDQREYLQILHEEIERGGHLNAVPSILQKKSKKRGRDVVFVSDSSDEDILDQINKKRLKN